MPLHMLVRNTVKDFNTWKRVFDEEAPNAAAHGITLLHLYRNADDPNEVHFILNVEDRDKAHAYTHSEHAAQVGVRAGATGGGVTYITTID